MAAIADAIGTLDPAAPRPSGADQVAAAVATWCAANPSLRLVIVMDQTEELVTMARTPADREAALALLARLLDAHEAQLRIVLTLRTDFEPQFDRSALTSRWKAGRFVIQPMSRADLQAVIEEPAARAVLYFDPPALVDALLDEVTNMPGALPLLSFALSEMYVRYVNRQATDRALTRDDYDQLGGVVGALRSRADEEYHALDDAHQATMQRMLLRMVGGGGGNLARRRASEVELVYRDATENARVESVRHRLVAARLLVEGKDTEGDAYLEPAHDALVRAWGRLIQWIQQAGGEAVPLVTRQKLALEAVEWQRATHKAARNGLLWKDPVRSAMLTPAVRGNAPWLNAVEHAFARESVSGRRRARRAAVGVTLLVALLGVASFMLWRRSEHDRVEAQANARSAIAARHLADSSAAEANLAAQRAAAEKVRTVRSLFSSLKVFMSNGRPGSVCVHASCGAPRTNDADAWIVISRMPNDVPAAMGPDSVGLVRDFIVGRDYGDGHIIVYAHEGLTHDSEIRGRVSDNLLFAENALRWLTPTTRLTGCPARTTILLWQGWIVPDQNRAVLAFIERRGWSLVVADPANLAQDLRCAGVLWFGNDWYPPADFATTHVPLIERFVRDGGGLLVGGLGWSWEGNDTGKPYPGDVLGTPFGFRFTRAVFYPDSRQVIPLLSVADSAR